MIFFMTIVGDFGGDSTQFYWLMIDDDGDGDDGDDDDDKDDEGQACPSLGGASLGRLPGPTHPT